MSAPLQPKPSFRALYIEPIHGTALYLHELIQGRLWLQVVIAMVLGLIVGTALGPTTGWTDPQVADAITSWLALPGQVFLVLLQMIVIPLVFTSIVLGLTSTQNLSQMKTLGLNCVIYFGATTVVAVIIGVLLALVIQPGILIDHGTIYSTLGTGADEAIAPLFPQFADLPGVIVTLLPRNPVSAMSDNEMLQVVVFAIVVGVALAMMDRSKAAPLSGVLESVLEVCMTVVRWAMILAPFAVFGLLAELTSKIGVGALVGMATYVGTVLFGLLLMFVLMILHIWVTERQNPLNFVKQTREVLLLAFSTSSSAAVMPLSIKVAESAFSVKPPVAKFVIPLGATVNMNGTALYQSVAAVFLAQVFDIELGLSGILLVVATTVGASIGTAATPGVGIVILAMVLSSIGVPPAGIALILGVDRILDMSRTVINVTGDICGAIYLNGVTDRLEKRAAKRAASTD